MSMTAELDDLLTALRARRLASAQIRVYIQAYIDNHLRSLGPAQVHQLATLEQEVAAWLTVQRMGGLRDDIRRRIGGRRAILLRLAERPETGSTG